MMVSLTMTTAMVSALTRLRAFDQAQEGIEEANEPQLAQPAEGKPITHGQIIQISKKLKQIRADSSHSDALNEVSYCLNDLLRGSKVYVRPTKPKAEPTSEYKALMARLRREEEDRAYERMINPPLPSEAFSQRFPKSSQANLFPASQADIGEDDEITYADINRQMALIINILISIVACSVAIWLAARHWSTPSRLGMSMGGSGMIGVAEIVVYAGYLRRLKDAREKGKKEVEVKEIVKTWVLGGEEVISSSTKKTAIKSDLSDEQGLRERKAIQR